MKKLLFTLAILSLSFSFFIGCSKDKKDDPKPIITPIDTTHTTPPPPTAADTLTGIWKNVTVSAIAGSVANHNYQSFNPVASPIVNKITLTFTATGVTQLWDANQGNWPNTTKTGTWTKTGVILTNNITSTTVINSLSGIPTTNTTAETDTYTMSYKKSITDTKDTIILVMNNLTAITTNGYLNAINGYGNTFTQAVPAPVLTLKFKKQ